MKITKIGIFVFTMGMVFADVLLALRMSNPILVKEALFYIENYGGVYFVLQMIINFVFGMIALDAVFLLEKYFERKSTQRRGKA